MSQSEKHTKDIIMALISATDFKVQTAAMAVALTAAFKDSVATRVADAIASPNHPLRNVINLLNFNAATGVFTSNDALVDRIYSNPAAPNLGSNWNGVPKAGRTRTAITPNTLTTATVETAAPNNIVLTFAQNIVETSNLQAFVTAANVPFQLLSVVKNVVTLRVVTAIVNGNVVTCAGAFGDAALGQVSLAAQAVTNNVA